MKEERNYVQEIQSMTERFYTLLQQSDVLTEDYLKEINGKLDREVRQQLLSPKPKVLVYGIYNSGKSTLVNAICGKAVAKVADRPMTDAITEYDVGNYSLIDSPGVDAPEEHEKIADAQLRQCHIILFVVSSKGGFESRANYQKMLELIKMKIPFYIVLNEKGEVAPGELNDIKEKIIHNLMKLSGDQTIDRQYDVIALNARRAWKGIEMNNTQLFSISGVPELCSRIETILDKDRTLTWLQAPAAALDANIGEVESKLYDLSGYNDYAQERQGIQAQTTRILSIVSDQIQNVVYSRFDEIYAVYCGVSQKKLEETTMEIAQDIESSYESNVASLNNYIKEKFPRLHQKEDGGFICIPTNLPEEEIETFLEDIQKGFENENFFLPSRKALPSGKSDKDITGTLGAMAAGAMLASAAAETAGASAVGGAVASALGTAGAAIGSTAAGAAVTGALGTVGAVLGSAVPVLAPIAILGGIISLFGGSGKKQEEEWQRMQAQAEAENARIREKVAEQARIRQDARAKTNAFLDDWAHQLRSAAKTQIETTYTAILQALDEDILKQQQTEQKVQNLLNDLHGLRQELTILRLKN